MFFKFAQTSSPGSSRFLIGTLQNYDGDGKGIVKKRNNNSARASRFFVHFFAVPAQLRREMTQF